MDKSFRTVSVFRINIIVMTFGLSMVFKDPKQVYCFRMVRSITIDDNHMQN